MSGIRAYAMPLVGSLILVNLASLLVLYKQQWEVERTLLECCMLKQEYNDIILLCRRQLLREPTLTDEDFEVKKKIIEEGSGYNPVSRSRTYVRDKSLAYAQRQGCYDDIKTLYGVNDRPQLAAPARKARKSYAGRRRSGKRHAQSRRAPSVLDIRAAPPFIWPLAQGTYRMSAGFGPRQHPRGHVEVHHGIDLAAPLGTPVRAAAGGLVTQARYAGGYGNTVVITHSDICTTRYAHLSKIFVEVGQEIGQGDILGAVGATGNVRGKNGVHLHFEVALHGKRINPCYVLP